MVPDAKTESPCPGGRNKARVRTFLFVPPELRLDRGDMCLGRQGYMFWLLYQVTFYRPGADMEHVQSYVRWKLM